MSTAIDSIDSAIQPQGLGKDGFALAGMFLVSGVTHFVRPETYETLVPRSLPARRAVVYVSGVAEIACAAGLLVPRTRRVAGLASAVLLVAIFPAHVSMNGQAKRLDPDPDNPDNPGRHGSLISTLARLPLEWPMVRAALRAGGVLR